jgi:hypothetical protein
MPNITLRSVTLALREKNTDGQPLESALSMLDSYISRIHSRWWHERKPRSRSEKPFRTHRRPSPDSVLSARLRAIGEYSPWGPGAGPGWRPPYWCEEEVEAYRPCGAPDHWAYDGGRVEPQWSPWKPVPPHAREVRDCHPCAERRADILGSGDSSPAVARPASRPAGRKRWNPRKAERQRVLRMDRAERPIDRGDALDERELAYLAHMRQHARLCGGTVALLERHLPAGGERIERLAVPMLCRTRICEACSDLRRRRATHRMEGPWRQLVTLTLRREGISEAHAWRHVPSWVGRLMSRIYDRSRRKAGRCECSRWASREEHDDIEVPESGFEYCWVIEPHKRGWPHVHIAWSSSYVCFDWVRDIWEEVTGTARPGTWVERHVTPERIPYYLAKYLTKGGMSEWEIALIRGRRIWASTVPQKLRLETSYQLVDILTGDGALAALQGNEVPMPTGGRGADVAAPYWEPVTSVAGKLSVWCSPEFSTDVGYIVNLESSWLRLLSRYEESDAKIRLRAKVKRLAILWEDSKDSTVSIEVFRIATKMPIRSRDPDRCTVSTRKGRERRAGDLGHADQWKGRSKNLLTSLMPPK